ncbi:GNAT family N-acetyltransferase [Thalassospira sp. A40-3]|uniref:GNAT family N-acetyltransferase n=1 Tax=Thalassospira sp. A40-3 TaxID=2785908 RepID=UPI002091B934|nr:GNAT family N-acetyltransferase [Thalassospira sp. A40-3]
MSSKAPRIETERLILRRMSFGDWPDYASMLASKRSAHMGGPYDTEAATALRDWAFNARGLPTLVSYIAPENDRSITLAERIGAVLDQTAQRPDPNDLVFRHAHPK